MKIIKLGKTYRAHKCSKCKTVYAYRLKIENGLIYCPKCGNFLDFHIFDKKISEQKYYQLKEVE